MKKFILNKFKEALKEQNVLEIENYEEVKELNVAYVYFKDSKLKYLRVPLNSKDENNCINIYHSKSSKNGYWWDGGLDYSSLVEELLKYS